MKRRLLLFAIIALFFCGRAHAVCPSGSNYGPGPLYNQTLTSQGTVTCFYAAANGSDSNAGTSKAAPFQHILDSPNCTATCHTVAVSLHNSAAAGNAVILRGGDTWDLGDTGAANYTGGTIDWNNSNYLGNASHPFYLGFDITWFSGGSWTQPILNADNPLCNNSTLGANCLSGSFGTGGINYVNTCAFQIASPTAGAQFQNDIIKMANLTFVIIDNIELRGLCAGPNAGNMGGVSNKFFALNSATNNTLRRLYIHGYSHVQFSLTCTVPTFPCLDLYAFSGSPGVSNATPDGNTYDGIYMDGSDSDPDGWGICDACDWNSEYSYYAFTTEGRPQSFHWFHDNWLDHIYDPGDNASHGNVFESHSDSQIASTNVLYNNKITNVSPDGHTQVNIWPQPCTPLSIGLSCSATLTTSDYFFGNVEYLADASVNGNYFNLGQNSNSQNQGNLVLLNDTWVIAGAGILMNGTSTFSHPTQLINQHYVTDATSMYSSPLPFTTFVTDGLSPYISGAGKPMSNATATTDGYTSANSYAPTSITSPTVAAGTNEQAICTALAAIGDPFIQAAAIACQSDTTLGVSINATTHTTIFPTRTPHLRPVSTAWDLGAFQFTPGGGGSVTVAPTSVGFGSVAQHSSSTSSTITLTNNSGSTITLTGVSYTGANAGDFTTGSIPTNTCGTGTVANAATCVLSVTFTPSASIGTVETGTLNIAYTGAAGSPQTVSLTGTSAATSTPSSKSLILSLNLMPEPAPAPIPTPALPILAAASYLSAQGFSQDAATHSSTLQYTISGTNLNLATGCMFDATPFPCTCASSTSCVITIPQSVAPIPATKTPHSIFLVYPAAPAVPKPS